MGRLPTASDLPGTLQVDIVPPPKNDQPTNVLVLLHGLGDTKLSFTRLGQQLNLPETACISVQGPKNVLDLGGFHWGDDILFDSNTGGLDSDAGFRETLALLTQLVDEVLVAKCGYKYREIVLLGFGQGGMAALRLAVALHSSASAQQSPSISKEFGGVISIGAALPSDAPASLDPLCKTPILVCAGSDQSSVTSSSEDKLKRNFEFVEVRRYRKPGDSMPSNRDEMMPIMQFFSRRLRSVKGVPEGSIEVS